MIGREPNHEVAGVKVLVVKTRVVQPRRQYGHRLEQVSGGSKSEAVRAFPARSRSTNSSSGIADEIAKVTR